MPALLALIPVRWLVVGLVILALVAGVMAMRAHDRSVGWDHALDAVKKQDTTAVDAARKAQKTVDECYTSNGTWSTITGECLP